MSVKTQWKGLKSILDVKDVNLYYGYVQGSQELALYSKKITYGLPNTNLADCNFGRA